MSAKTTETVTNSKRNFGHLMPSLAPRYLPNKSNTHPLLPNPTLNIVTRAQHEQPSHLHLNPYPKLHKKEVQVHQERREHTYPSTSSALAVRIGKQADKTLLGLCWKTNQPDKADPGRTGPTKMKLSVVHRYSCPLLHRPRNVGSRPLPRSSYNCASAYGHDNKQLY